LRFSSQKAVEIHFRKFERKREIEKKMIGREIEIGKENKIKSLRLHE